MVDGKDKLTDAAKGAADKAGDMAKGAADSAKNAVGDAAQGAADSAKNMAGDAVDKAGDAAKGVADSAKGAVGGAAGKLGGIAGSVTDKAGDVAKGAADSAKDAVGGAADKVSGMAGSAADKAGDAAKGAVGGAADGAKAAAGKVGDSVSSATNKLSGGGGGSGGSGGDGDDGGMMKWLLPLILLAIIVILGFWFCGKGKSGDETPANTNTNANAGEVDPAAAEGNESVQSMVKVESKDGKYFLSGKVKDEDTKNSVITETQNALGGEEKVDSSGLTVDEKAQPMKDGWMDAYKGFLPSLTGMTAGAISWMGETVRVDGTLPDDLNAKIKSSFGEWVLPASVVGEEGAAEQALEKASEQLENAKTPEEVTNAMNNSIINFATGSSDIPENAKDFIAKATEKLKSLPAETRIEVGGYTDVSGDDQKNMKLSEDRANSVMSAFVEGGVAKEMLTAKGYGETTQFAEGDSKDAYFQNRRIAYKLTTAQ